LRQEALQARTPKDLIAICVASLVIFIPSSLVLRRISLVISTPSVLVVESRRIHHDMGKNKNGDKQDGEAIKCNIKGRVQ
jgi:hypothetical protein